MKGRTEYEQCFPPKKPTGKFFMETNEMETGGILLLFFLSLPSFFFLFTSYILEILEKNRRPQSMAAESKALESDRIWVHSPACTL